jgi:hypothetical protein
LSADGETLRDIDRTRWRGEQSAVLFWTARDGRGSIPNLYVLPAPLQAEPAPAWWPREKQLLKTWCAVAGAAEQAARERLKAKGEASPADKRLCEELSAMWQEAGREGGSAKSIETTRSRTR